MKPSKLMLSIKPGWYCFDGYDVTWPVATSTRDNTVHWPLIWKNIKIQLRLDLGKCKESSKVGNQQILSILTIPTLNESIFIINILHENWKYGKKGKMKSAIIYIAYFLWGTCLHSWMNKMHNLIPNSISVKQ